MRSFLGELDPVPVCFLQLVGKRYPLKAVSHTKTKKEVEEEENYSLQTESTWEHKALSGTDSILCARCKSVLLEAPENGGVSTRGETHQWLSGDLTGENFSAHNQ